ncbi:hypothetical protein CYMTET_24754 [Cymbomonas tetramitiformis]|uniref:Uncharacterized protein n=1 Tax=Cymbomonas tetramitiformis TaxID=36881 RepID=A0AAE0FVX8_9CHLO|nr:hypothetical protein CYMTET_24754 [Cymbomonas tetramitiformis]
MSGFGSEGPPRERRGFRGTAENAKTVLCTRFTSPEGCRFGDRCNFAHGDTELRPRPPRGTSPRGSGNRDPWAANQDPLGPQGGNGGGSEQQEPNEEYRLWSGGGRGGGGGYVNGTPAGPGSGGAAGDYKLWSGRGGGGYGGIGGPGASQGAGQPGVGAGAGGPTAGAGGQGNDEEYRLWGNKSWGGNGVGSNGGEYPGAAGQPAFVASDNHGVSNAWANKNDNSTSDGTTGAEAAGASSHGWTTHCAPDGHCYYYNTKTGVSQWERPMEMDFPMSKS